MSRTKKAKHTGRLGRGAALLKTWMDSVQMTQSELGSIIRVTQGCVNQYLAGKCRPRYEVASRIARASRDAVPIDAWVRE